MTDQDTEITLGAGRLLGLFFGLAVLCAIFFVMGYSLGRSVAPASTTLTAEPTVPPAVASNNVNKPAATQDVVPKPDCANSPETCPPASDEANTTKPEAAAPAPAPANSAIAAPAPEQKAVTAAPEVTRNIPSSGYVVQVAAVSKQQDAENLVAALKKKQYPVFIATQGSDPLFHVQIGPFTEAKDAEAMRTRLVTDGYNPILKK